MSIVVDYTSGTLTVNGLTVDVTNPVEIKRTGAGRAIEFFNGTKKAGAVEIKQPFPNTEGDLTIGAVGMPGASTSAGLYFEWMGSKILPYSMDTGLTTNGVTSLGDVSERFYGVYANDFDGNSLYLSGGVYLGGSGSAANLLDDYEEGNWTPTFVNAGTLTYTINSGRYTKIGNLVHVQVHFDVGTLGSASGHIRVTGLPFVVKNDNPQYGITSSIYGSSFGVSRATNNLVGISQFNTTLVDFYYNSGTTGSPNQLLHSDLSVGNLLFSMTYRTT